MAYGKVLAVLTGDTADQGVLAQGADMVRPVKGRLFAVYVIRVDRALPVDAEIGPATAMGEEILAQAEVSVRLPRGDFEAQLLQARELGPAVVQEATLREVDAVVVGATCRTEFGRLALGDDVPYVLEHAPCLVVLWREAPPRRSQRDGRLAGTRVGNGVIARV